MALKLTTSNKNGETEINGVPVNFRADIKGKEIVSVSANSRTKEFNISVIKTPEKLLNVNITNIKQLTPEMLDMAGKMASKIINFEKLV